MRATTQPRGFTLLELMVAGALLALVLAASMSVLVSFNVSTNQAVLFTDVQSNARFTLEEFEQEIRQAGLGASNGTVGVAPGGTWSTRLPTMFSGPVQSLTDPSGNSYSQRSVYVISAEPATVGFNAAGDGVVGTIVTSDGALVQCNILASTSTGGLGYRRDCKAPYIGSDGFDHGLFLQDSGGAYLPLLVHDMQRASIISPISVTLAAGNTSQVTFAEQGSSTSNAIISPNPAAPFGFAQGFQVSRARVSHWYLQQKDQAAPPRLMRSHPTMTTGGSQCSDGVFVDETTSAGGVVGKETGAGPIESLQVRFVFDYGELDDPTKYQVVDSIDPCQDTTTLITLMRQLREVRIQMTAIATSASKGTSTQKIVRYQTPQFEGSGPTGANDAYPRRAFVTRIAPRNIEPYR